MKKVVLLFLLFSSLAFSQSPTVISSSSSQPTNTTIRIDYTVNANGSNTTVAILYGLTQSNLNQTFNCPDVSGNSNVNQFSVITGLLSGTNYYYGIKVTNSNGTITRTGTLMAGIVIPFQFATTGSPAIVPTISDISSNVTSNSGTINYSLNANGSAATSIVKWGFQANNVANQVTGFSATGNTLTTGTALIPGLTENTQYYYRIDATNATGLASSTVGTFRTLIRPTFTQRPAICSGTTMVALPTTSNNSITGTWSPALNNMQTTTYTFTPTNGQSAETVFMTITVIPTLVPTFLPIAPLCAGTLANPLPFTSDNGIVGSWSPAFNNQATQTYTFTPSTVIAQCATTTSTLTITINQKITPTFNPINIPVCSSLSISQASDLVIPQLPTTSTNGITGSWVWQQTNTQQHTFRFEPVAGSCANMITVVIVKNPLVTIVFTPLAPQCSGSTFALPLTDLSGITGTWSPAVNNLVTTVYTFTPTAGQCVNPTIVNMTVVINQSITPVFAAIAPICSGATLAALPTTSTNGITGTWSPALNNTTTTTYTFLPTTGQCATSVTKVITVNSSVTPTGNATQTFVQGTTLTSVLINPSNIIWYASNANAISGSNQLPNNTVLINGTTYYAVNLNGTCRSTPFPVTVVITLNAANFNKFDFKLYPNPTNNVLNIEITSQVKSIEIYNIQGQKVKSATQKQINVSDLASGIYMIKIQDTENAVSTKKFLKQ